MSDDLNVETSSSGQQFRFSGELLHRLLFLDDEDTECENEDIPEISHGLLYRARLSMSRVLDKLQCKLLPY